MTVRASASGPGSAATFPRRSAVMLLAAALLCAGLPARGEDALALSGEALASARDEDEGDPKQEWDRLRRAVLGFSDLVGRVSTRKLTFRKLPPVTDVRGQVRITGEGWRFENVTGDICGGRVSAEAAIDFLHDFPGKKTRRFRLRANIAGANLEDITRHYDVAVMPGSISGRLELSVASEKGSLHGRAEFHIRKADLGRMPLAIKAVSFIFLGFPRLQDEVISQADAHLTLTPRGLVFQDLSLRSGSGAFSIEAERNGTINYKGEINLYFRPVFEEGFAKVIPGLPEVIHAIRGRGGRVRVTGTVHEPKFKWGAFR